MMENKRKNVLDISFVSGKDKFNYRVCGILISNGKLLAMHDERSPYFYLPGGRVKMGETAEEAIIREIEEELDFKPRILRPLWLNQGFFTEDVDGLCYHELCVYFLLDASDPSLLRRGERFTLQEGRHTHDFEWLAFDRLKDEYFYPLFLKTGIFRLPETFTILTEREPAPEPHPAPSGNENCTIRKVRPGDEETLAYIQTESWKAAFLGILSDERLQRSADPVRATAMYRRLLDEGIGNGYLLEVDGKPHAIAWWDRSRDAEDPAGFAELICIHSLPDHWGMGFGKKLMDRILSDIREAGYTRVMLWVFTENTRARRFYEACGFVATNQTKPCFETQEIRYEKTIA